MCTGNRSRSLRSSGPWSARALSLLLSFSLIGATLPQTLSAIEVSTNDWMAISQHIQESDRLLTLSEQQLDSSKDDLASSRANFAKAQQELTAVRSLLQQAIGTSGALRQDLQEELKQYALLMQRFEALSKSFDEYRTQADQNIQQVRMDRDREAKRADALKTIAGIGPIIAGVVGLLAGLVVGRVLVK